MEHFSEKLAKDKEVLIIRHSYLTLVRLLENARRKCRLKVSDKELMEMAGDMYISQFNEEQTIKSTLLKKLLNSVYGASSWEEHEV